MANKEGVTQNILVQQVKGAIPSVGQYDSPAARLFEHLAAQELNDLEYFKLLVTSHMLTCASFLPTDVDQQIRLHAWMRANHDDTLEMAQFILNEVAHWDHRKYSRRFVTSNDRYICGHHGEILTIITGAYGRLQMFASKEARSMQEKILDFIRASILMQEAFFKSLHHDGKAMLEACAAITHNCGDLDRSCDLWQLELLGLRHAARPGGALVHIGELYQLQLTVAGTKTSMALENHRHYALRQVPALRQNPVLLMPTAPFLDAWGALLQTHLPEIGIFLEERFLHHREGISYARALCGMNWSIARQKTPHLIQRPQPDPKTKTLRKLLSMSQNEFETRCAEQALTFIRGRHG